MATIYNIFCYFWDLFLIPINMLFEWNIPIYDNISVSAGVLLCGVIGTFSTIIFTFTTLNIIKSAKEE